jgi:uncharacterized protein (DUF4415 family)
MLSELFRQERPQKKNKHTIGENMKKEYDLSKLKSRKNPYAKQLKKQITIRIGSEAIDYFKTLSKQTGMSYQNLINSYLLDCAFKKKKMEMSWR